MGINYSLVHTCAHNCCAPKYLGQSRPWRVDELTEERASPLLKPIIQFVELSLKHFEIN